MAERVAGVKSLSLRPYHGEIRLCDSLAELRKEYRRLTRERYPYEDDPEGGRYVKIVAGDGGPKWLVFAANHHCLAHEFAHVLLHTFGTLGHDPTAGDGEPFCYMLSQLLLEAK